MSVFDMLAGAGEDVLAGLRRAGLDPESFGPMDYTPEVPEMRQFKPSWLDYVAPVVEAIAGYENPRRERRNKWLGPGLAALAHTYTGFRSGEARDVAMENARALASAREANRAGKREADTNRRTFQRAVRAQTVDGVLKSPAEIEAGKTEAAANRAKATSAARVEGTNAARKEAGVPPVGASKPKATPKPKGPTDAETRRRYVIGIVTDLRKRGVTMQTDFEDYLKAPGVMDTLAAHGIKPSDLRNEFAR